MKRTILDLWSKRPAPGELTFRCNVCGATNTVPATQLSREVASCSCGSTVRNRGVIRALSLALFGRSLAIPDFPDRKDLKGIGMSDWEGYAQPLARKLGYENTYLHKAPKLDILAIESRPARALDFIITSDVYEHVPPPVSRAFENARTLLKPGGVLVFTVPYMNEPGATTKEHFPELHEFSIVRDGGKPRLKNRTRDGREQVFEDLVFHGGEGDTLEMRVFAEESLRRDFEAAGFKDFKIHREADFEHGVYQEQGWSLPITARA